MSAVARQDIRTVTGSNVAFIRRETGMDPVLASLPQLKCELQRKLASVPDMDRWRVKYLTRLLSDRGEAHYRGDEEEVERLSVCLDRQPMYELRLFFTLFSLIGKSCPSTI